MGARRPLSGPDLQDVGLYLQGLLQVMAADHNLDRAQRDAIRAYAMSQGFDERYVDDTIESLLDNAHFPRMPPRFNHEATARKFLREAARIAICDGLLHPRERAWLVEAASCNHVDSAIVLDVLEGVPLSEQRPAG